VDGVRAGGLIPIRSNQDLAPVSAPPPLTSPALLSPRERREKDLAKQELLPVPLSPLGREGLGE
jgi:hypothetical protein